MIDTRTVCAPNSGQTDDFRLSFHLMRELKRRKCDFVMLSSGEKWDGVLLTSPEEVQDGEIPATEETLEISVERAIQASRAWIPLYS